MSRHHAGYGDHHGARRRAPKNRHPCYRAGHRIRSAFGHQDGLNHQDGLFRRTGHHRSGYPGLAHGRRSSWSFLSYLGYGRHDPTSRPSETLVELKKNCVDASQSYVSCRVACRPLWDAEAATPCLGI